MGAEVIGGTSPVLERGLDTSNGLDFVRERLALVAGGRAPSGGSAPVPGGAGVADRTTGKAKGVAHS